MNINYLHTPIASIVAPPINTKEQELPIDKLKWEDFEKLCLAIVQTEYSIDNCEIYGVKGQAQYGIDIYARQPNNRYTTYQSKRYSKYTTSNLAEAIESFRQNKFYQTSDKFVICTSCEWGKTELQDKFEDYKSEFRLKNIELEKWDKTQLSRKLKALPQIVYDFFGLEWVKIFNGELCLNQLSKNKKLDATQIAAFRNELYHFYSTIFNIQDPGIPIQELNKISYQLQERFILPDLILNVHTELEEEQKYTFEQIDYQSLNNEENYQYYYDNYTRPYFKIEKNKYEIKTEDIIKRTNIKSLTFQNRKNIILGDPGSGKSTLLRYLTLDILSETPSLDRIAIEYGQLLPVWLPFAFITKHLSKNDSLSISELLNMWFKMLGKEELFQMVNKVLLDERLLLIVDGVDEWNSISSAQQAISRIEATIGLFNARVIYSSRPYGFRLLKDSFNNIDYLTLAPFSQDQQRLFIQKWYNKWMESLNISDSKLAESNTISFIKELSKNKDYAILAESPLLLSILLIQKMRDSTLSKDKLKAFNEITEYLINKHPLKRKKDAGIVDELSMELDYTEIFCSLAMYIQKGSNDGIITKSEACYVIESYLKEYAGYTTALAKLRSKELVDVGANHFGIIIEKSPEEISFIHRQFQEYLAARYLWESDSDIINDTLKVYGANPVFHQVLILFFSIIPTKRVNEFKGYFTYLSKITCHTHKKDYLKLLLYEIILDSKNSPLEYISTYFNKIIIDFEYETFMPLKEKFLQLIIRMLSNTRIKDEASQYLLQYIPNVNYYSDSRISALGSTETLTCKEFEFLKRYLFNGNTLTKLSASNTLKKHIKNSSVYSYIVDLVITFPAEPEIIAYAINCLITDELDTNSLDKILKQIKSTHPLIQLFKVKYKVFRKKQTIKDLNTLIKINKHIPGDLSDEILNVLIDGYSNSIKLKNIALASLKDGYKGVLDQDIAMKYLFHCDNKNEKVVDWLISEMSQKEHPLLGIGDRKEMWGNISYYFKGNKRLKEHLEVWILEDMKKYSHLSIEASYSSIIANTDRIEVLLWKDLQKSFVSHWPVMSLLEGYGTIPTTISKLKNYFRTESTGKTSYAAHYISQVFADEKEEGIKLLEDIFFNRDLFFRNRAIHALIELDKAYFEKKLLKVILDNEIDLLHKNEFCQYYDVLEVIAKHYSENPLIKTYILRNVNDHLVWNIFIKYYSEDSNVIESILEKSLPLDNELRFKLIKELTKIHKIDDKIVNRLYKFKDEINASLKADLALCLFNHLKNNKQEEEIIKLCEPLIFARGYDYEINRNIAFTGYLMTHRLNEYLTHSDEYNKNAKPENILIDENSYGFDRYTSDSICQLLVSEFEYLVSVVGEDLSLLRKSAFNEDIQHIWIILARYSDNASPTAPYILRYIENNINEINDRTLIHFLARLYPKLEVTRTILLRETILKESKNKAFSGRLLGLVYSGDKKILARLTESKLDYLDDYGKVIALATGWEDAPILKDTFNSISTIIQNNDHFQVNYYISFHLKFLFRDIKNLMDFLNYALSETDEIKRLHNYFYNPLIDRLRKDKILVQEIKNKLILSQEINKVISYYNLLAKTNNIDNEIQQWKSSILERGEEYGFDIVSNKTIRLSELLNEYHLF